jgi:hypothetical protein
MSKSHQRKSDHRFLRKNSVYTYGAPVFAPNCSTTILASKICTNSDDHFMYIRFLWPKARGRSSIEEQLTHNPSLKVRILPLHPPEERNSKKLLLLQGPLSKL